MSLTRGLAASAFFATGLAIDFSADARLSAVAVGLGQLSQLTSINAGVTCWLSGLGTHNIYGNLNNAGNLVISQTDWTASIPGGQTSDWAVGLDSGNLVNTGAILLNDVAAASAPTYDWIIQTVKNSGSIQWCGRGDTGGSTYHLSTAGDLINDVGGLIVFEQVYGNLGTAMTFQNTVPTVSSIQATTNVYNNGGFLIRKARLDLMQQILGTGCWMIDVDATLYLQDGLSAFNNYGYKSSLAGQSISFVGASGTLHMDTAVYSHNSVFGAAVYGFSSGKVIEFYEIIKSISYDGSKGVLSVFLTSSNHVDITIGKGYDASKFSFKAHVTYYAAFNAVFYDGPAPAQTAPQQCSLTADTCKPLTGYPSTSTSSVAVSTSSTLSKSTISSTSTTVSTSSTSTSVSTSSTSTSVSSRVPISPPASSAPGVSTVTVTTTASASTVTATASASTVTATAPASTVTATAPANTVTSTLTASAGTVTSTLTAPASTVTSTLTAPASTVTSTLTAPGGYPVTITKTASAKTVTVTAISSQPASTVTVVSTSTLPASTIVSTSTLPAVTITSVSTQPASTITSTYTQPAVTITSVSTQPASIVTQTKPGSTVTQTQPANTITITPKPSTVTKTTAKTTATVTSTCTETETDVVTSTVTSCDADPTSY